VNETGASVAPGKNPCSGVTVDGATVLQDSTKKHQKRPSSTPPPESAKNATAGLKFRVDNPTNKPVRLKLGRTPAQMQLKCPQT